MGVIKHGSDRRDNMLPIFHQNKIYMFLLLNIHFMFLNLYDSEMLNS